MTSLNNGKILYRLNNLQQFLTFLKPGHRIHGSLNVLDHPVLIHDDRGGALDSDHAFSSILPSKPGFETAISDQLGEHIYAPGKLDMEATSFLQSL